IKDVIGDANLFIIPATETRSEVAGKSLDPVPRRFDRLPLKFIFPNFDRKRDQDIESFGEDRKEEDRYLIDHSQPDNQTPVLLHPTGAINPNSSQTGDQEHLR